MIKYYSFEHTEDKCGNFITMNEKILNNEPFTNDFGWYCIVKLDNIKLWYIDVQKRIEYNGSLVGVEKKVYDKLLIEQRNKKLDTL